MSRRLAALALALGALLAPETALACSVCFAADEETRAAFLLTTLLLSVLPLALIGGIVGLLWHRSRVRAASPVASAPRPAPTGAPAPLRPLG